MRILFYFKKIYLEKIRKAGCIKSLVMKLLRYLRKIKLVFEMPMLRLLNK